MDVYVLGAGASAHANYPLAAALGMSLAAWIQTLEPEHRYRSRLKQVTNAYGTIDDFEAILADLMTSGRTPATIPTIDRPYLLDDLKEAICEYFDTIRPAPASLYDLLAQRLRPGDVVVTFNYDLGIERSLSRAGLWKLGTGYGFHIDGYLPSSIEVLKLHGSTNWRALLFGGRTGYFAANDGSLGTRPVLFFRRDQTYLGFPEFVDPLCAGLDTAVTLPAVIMPALPKEFYFRTSYGLEWETFWNGLWQRAAEAVARADQLVLIGYSLPVVDQRARELLLGMSNKMAPLTVCCGPATKCLEQEFRGQGFTAIRGLKDPTFTGFLSANLT